MLNKCLKEFSSKAYARKLKTKVGKGYKEKHLNLDRFVILLLRLFSVSGVTLCLL